MSTVPIFGPQCPFLGLIPGGLKLGHSLRIRATITNYNSRCHINIQSGASLRPRDDTVLHLSIRPQENCIVRNHFCDQVWGNEERHGGMPIKWQESFEISFAAEPSLFRIAINGQHFCTFNYRLPIALAQFVSIDGGCTIQYINIDEPNLSIPNAPPAAPYYVAQTTLPPYANIAPVPVVPAPGYPQHFQGYPPQNYPPAPPPMPSAYSPPPPYGHYPTPYSATTQQEKEKKKDKNNLKIAAGVGAVAGLTAVALSSASRGLRKHRK